MAIKARADELTAADAAMALGWSAQRVIYMVQKKRLQGTRRNGHWYVKFAAVARERARAGR
jgi:hypothetical protein